MPTPAGNGLPLTLWADLVRVGSDTLMAIHGELRSGNLLVIDQLPLMEEATDFCRDACQRLERLRTDLNQYESRDLPAYSRRLNASFGSALAEIRELSARIHEKETLVGSLR